MNILWLAYEFAALNVSDKRQEINYAAAMFWGIAEFLFVIDHSPMFMSRDSRAAVRFDLVPQQLYVLYIYIHICILFQGTGFDMLRKSFTWVLEILRHLAFSQSHENAVSIRFGCTWMTQCDPN